MNSWLRSALALIAGFAAVAILSIASDMALQAAGIFPPFSETPFPTPLLLIATAHRCVWAVLGSTIAARLAPNRAMGHALVLGGIGLVLNVTGLVVMWRMGAHWYPIALILTALPCAWLGDALAGGRKA